MTQTEYITTPCESVSILYGLGSKPLPIGVFILDAMERTKFNTCKASGIYQIQSTINGKQYVGSAVNLRKRELDHFRDLKKGRHNKHLQNHYNKYGKNDLLFSVLEFCDEERKILLQKEDYYINKLSPEFNMNPKATSNLGFKFSKESKQKVSIASNKYWSNPENRRKAGIRSNEKWKNPETQRKIIGAINNYWADPENRKRRSVLNKERYKDLKEREKTGKAMKHVMNKPEVKIKTSIASNKYWSDPKNRKKASEQQKGKRLSKNTKKRMSEARIRLWADPEWRKKMIKSMQGKKKTKKQQ